MVVDLIYAYNAYDPYVTNSTRPEELAMANSCDHVFGHLQYLLNTLTPETNS